MSARTEYFQKQLSTEVLYKITSEKFLKFTGKQLEYSPIFLRVADMGLQLY